MRKRYTVFLAVLLAAGILSVTGYLLLQRTENKLEALSKVPVREIDLWQVPDGTYTGEKSVFPLHVIVRVSVRDHVITAIVLEKHDNGQGEAAEVLLDEILRAQSIDLDAVSGATYSSKVILLAVQDALWQ